MDRKSLTCNYCSKVLSCKYNLYQHMKYVHKRNEKGDKIIVNEFSCDLCDKKFKYNRTLQQHKQRVHVHPDIKYSCNLCKYKTDIQPHLKRHVLKVHKPEEESSVRSFKCSNCNAKYKNKKHLTNHERKTHKIGNISLPKEKKCPICKYMAKTNDEMYTHYKNTHAISVKSERFNLNSMEDFFIWKKEIEKNTVSLFTKTSSSVNITVYQCNRCGFYNEPKTRQRRIKLVGTNKINGFCPAMIRVKKLEHDTVSVLYISTHVGHKNELKHLRLSKDDRKNIATQLASNVPHQEILKSIRNSITNSEVERIHLIKKEDLVNIENSYLLNNEVIKEQYDPKIVEACVNELKTSEDTALLVYKPQYVVSDEFPQLREEDFLLIYMSEAQKTILQKYNNDIVCIDGGTHGLKNYKFQLYTVLTMDETREGFPAVFMFSNRGDETVFQIFFAQIKNVLGCITPNTFMSDMEDTFYAAWSKTMGFAKNRVYCTWHVLKAWSRNLQNKIKIKEKREAVFNNLKTLMYERDELAFKKMLDEALKRMSNDHETTLFCTYFQEYYLNNDRYRFWAYCYRINAGINTNMSLENFHRVLKYFILKGKHVRRLDKTLCAILNVVKDELFDLLIKFDKGKLVPKLRALRSRHKASFSLDEDKILTLPDDEWQVCSSTQTEFYNVRRIKQCTTCSQQCTHCKSCFHEYVCTCIDNAIKHNMCKHIHLVCRTLIDNPVIQVGSPTLEIEIEYESEQMIETSIIDEISNNEETPHLKKEREKVTEKLKSIETMLHNEEDIEIADKFLDKLIKKLQQRAPTVKQLQDKCNTKPNPNLKLTNQQEDTMRYFKNLGLSIDFLQTSEQNILG